MKKKMNFVIIYLNSKLISRYIVKGYVKFTKLTQKMYKAGGAYHNPGAVSRYISVPYSA